MAKNVRTTKRIESAPSTIIKTTTKKTSKNKKTGTLFDDTTKVNKRIGVMNPKGKIIESYPVLLPLNPSLKLLGTIGNYGDSIEDSWNGVDHLYFK